MPRDFPCGDFRPDEVQHQPSEIFGRVFTLVHIFLCIILVRCIIKHLFDEHLYSLHFQLINIDFKISQRGQQRERVDAMQSNYIV